MEEVAVFSKIITIMIDPNTTEKKITTTMIMINNMVDIIISEVIEAEDFTILNIDIHIFFLEVGIQVHLDNIVIMVMSTHDPN